MEDIVKVVKFLEESGLMTEGSRETIENEMKQKITQKGGFIGVTR